MKTIMISIKPKWLEKILSGKKTVEVRKFKIEPPFKVIVYEPLGKWRNAKIEIEEFRVNNTNVEKLSKETLYKKYREGSGKVVGEFICNKSTEIECDSEQYKALEKETCLTFYDFFDYSNGKILYGYYVDNLIIYNEPKKLSEFYTIKKCVPCDSPFGYSWSWEDRHKGCSANLPRENWGVPIECSGCKNLFVSKEPYESEESGCMLFDYECKTKYHKPIKKPPQNFIYIQDREEEQ